MNLCQEYYKVNDCHDLFRNPHLPWPQPFCRSLCHSCQAGALAGSGCTQVRDHSLACVRRTGCLKGWSPSAMVWGRYHFPEAGSFEHLDEEGRPMCPKVWNKDRDVVRCIKRVNLEGRIFILFQVEFPVKTGNYKFCFYSCDCEWYCERVQLFTQDFKSS